MLHLITKKNKPILLYTSSQLLAKFLTHEVIQNLGYVYSENKITNKTVINCFDCSTAREINPQDDTIIISTVNPSVWKELVSSLEIIDLDNLPAWLKVVLLSFFVFENKNLRKGFSSNFWKNCLKLFSNNFFEIYFFYKVLGNINNSNSGGFQDSEKINLNKSLIYEVLSYIEDSFAIGNGIGVYPDIREKNKFLYFLLDPEHNENTYKVFMDIDLIERVYYKYKILADLSSKEIENLVISDREEEISKFLDILANLGNFSYLTWLDVYPNWNSDLVGKLNFGDLLTVYPFSLIFCLLGKKVLVIQLRERYYLFEIKESKNVNIDIKSFFKRYGVEVSFADLVYYKPEEIYSSFTKLIISSLRSNPEVAYGLISTPLLAYDYNYYNDRGFISMVLEKFDESKIYFDKYLEIDDKDVLFNYNLAVFYWLNGDYKRALEILEKKVDSQSLNRFFGVIIPIFPYRKKTLIFDVDGALLYKISRANLLFLNNNKEEAKELISKIDIQKAGYNREFLEYFRESLNFINNE